MKLVFNETLLSSVCQDSSNISDSTKILTSNIILEKKIVTAQVADMNDLFRQLNALRTPADKVALLKRPYVVTFLNTTIAPGRTNNDVFLERWVGQTNSSSGANQSSSVADYVREQIQEGSRATEDPAIFGLIDVSMVESSVSIGELLSISNTASFILFPNSGFTCATLVFMSSKTLITLFIFHPLILCFFTPINNGN